MCQKKYTAISRYELVEVVILPTTTNEVDFPDTPNLQNNRDQRVIIKDIEIFPAYAQTGSYKNAGSPVVPVTEIPKAGLILYYLGGEWVRIIPLAKMIYTDPGPGGAGPFQHERVAFDDLQEVAINKCKIVFNTAPAFAGGVQYVIPVGITYLKLTERA